jgi:preprotein translocase subunit SecG
MQVILFIIHILASLALIALVIIQKGKGSDIGAAFGGGASNTLFGSQGAVPFFAKLTAVVAVIFFATSLALGYSIAKQAKQSTNVIIPAQHSQSK